MIDNAAPPGSSPTAPKPTRRLSLKRETVQDLSSEILSSQGHSLWTCDGSLHDDSPPAVESHAAR
jgi:hypothetical protein